jgi:uncharacterized peroxidase-related enzyme
MTSPETTPAAWIRMVADEEATGETAELFEELRRTRGAVFNLHRVHSLHAGSLKALLCFIDEVLNKPGALSACDRELIATVVSAENGCDYCTLLHAEALKSELVDPDLPRRAAFDFRSAGLPERQRVMLCHATRLTNAPATIGPEDIDALRSAGFDDAAILEINLVTSYFSYLNRVALGLGVQLDPGTSNQPS